MHAIRKTLIACATVAMCCVGCKSTALGGAQNTPSGSAPSNHAPVGGGANAPLARSRLAPSQVGTVPPNLHCHMGGNDPKSYRPDASCTPGAVQDSVTQANIDSTICTTGYTTKIRPATSATDKIKHALYTAYGVPDNTKSELDHLVSLELGGSNDTANLWPEPGTLPNPKDSVENALHKAVCAHKVTLAAAQQAIATNWTTALAVTGAGK
ncbi:hypothetical protein Caci_6525 [Catenulispora acidiphila DSM 44928]|uniref:HNH endonuclease n=1 Tax=Catenulispora acidiphila (strain DSM 44928 / JCM 14897 / NBRC 102108 / NRRL B-24433 / ID139908) TaxID=479433 RepID=C7PY83_CATAD|nr:hypothetical protein [Catenulispora acidiphila]ACU75373.1 hypothetical protein Caci_6525 [Catenulispora acidiphila DSM 44928]